MDKTIRPSKKSSTPKNRVINQLQNFMTRPDPKYGDTFRKIKNQYPGLLKNLGLPSEQKDIWAAAILTRVNMNINTKNIRLIKELDGKLTKLVNTFYPQIAELFLESGKNPLETPLDELQSYIDGFGGRFDNSDTSNILKDIKPKMRPAIISLKKALNIIIRNEGLTLGYALKSGNTGTLGALLNIAESFGAKVNYAVYDETPIKEKVMHESGIRAEIKRACEYEKTFLTT